MAARNDERRTQILSMAYKLLSEKEYNRVSLAEIAKNVGISKSLLQRYYPQKISIVQSLLKDILNISFSYMEYLPWEYSDIFQRISDFDRLFFHMTERNWGFEQFILASVGNSELLDIWIDILCEWLKKLCKEDTFSYLQLRKALCFSMGGAMHLFQHKHELGIDYHEITELDIRATLQLLGCEENRIENICRLTNERTDEMNPDAAWRYCEEKISWMDS